MVKGLDQFREHFRGLVDRYVLIGGTACDIAFDAAGVTFRATRDLDIVLCVESLDAEFAKAFWEFVRLGGYKFQSTSTGERRRYRFEAPTEVGFPVMLELFARASDLLGEVSGVLTRIPINEDVSSLSAILLDDGYYAWIQSGKQVIDGLAVLRPEHLIPLKAKAWLDLRRRAAEGETIDGKDIRKHKNDVFRLWSIVDPTLRPSLPATIARDMRVFLDEVEREPPDLKSLGLHATSVGKVLDALRAQYVFTT